MWLSFPPPLKIKITADVPRHQARVIELEYTGEGATEKTLLLVGKV